MTEPEWLTRKKRIDSKLRSLNPFWEITSFSKRAKPSAELTQKRLNRFSMNSKTKEDLNQHRLKPILLFLIQTKKIIQEVAKHAYAHEETFYAGRTRVIRFGFAERIKAERTEIKTS